MVVSATGYVYDVGSNSNTQMDVAAGGIFVCGLALGLIGVIVMFFGSKWIEMLMPPGNTYPHLQLPFNLKLFILVVTGTVVITIGIHLSTSALDSATQTALDSWVAFATALTTILVSIYAPGILKRIPVLLGLIVGYVINFVVIRFGYGLIIDYSIVNQSSWFGVPKFIKPKFEAHAISIIVPVCIVLLAENLGHLKAVSATVEKSLDKYIGRAIIGDAVATIVSASGSGPGTTTYAENIGVMVKINSSKKTVPHSIVSGCH